MLAVFIVGGAGRPLVAQTTAVVNAVDDDGVLPADAFSPAFLGMYRKIMRIDRDITRYAQVYGVDPQLARAVCMFESGGNENLTSGAGARGYFQVIPSTFRLMGVPTNIEAGIKYLSQLIAQFGREDYAVAAYNGGPGRVAREQPMPLESLQYVLGVGYYRSVLKQHEPEVRRYAATLAVVQTNKGDTWEDLSKRLHVDAIDLRLFNPFINEARLRSASRLIAYPTGRLDDMFETGADGRIAYRTRIGDNYINLAFAFDVDVDRLREANELWRLQLLPANTMLTIPGADDDVQSAERRPEKPAVEAASLVSVPQPKAARQPSVHTVRRGDTLSELAERYGTTASAIRSLNRMGRRTSIRIGERLRIPAR